jgi:hypothetical protein
MFNDDRSGVFSKILSKAKEQHPNNKEFARQNLFNLPHIEEEGSEKERRRQLGSTEWELELEEDVLLKCQPN